MCRSFLFVLLLIPSLAVNAQSLLPFPGTGAKPDDRKEAPGAPDPGSLPTDWWKYFDVEGDALEERVAHALDRIDSSATSLPVDIIESARPLMEHLKANIEALPRARSQPTPELPLAAVAEPQYTPSQLAQLAARVRQAKVELSAEKTEIEAAEKAIRAARLHYDTLFATYLEDKAGTSSHLLKGIQLMAERSALAISSAQLGHQKAVIQTRSTGLEHLSSELNTAKQRLVSLPPERDRLDSEIEQARAAHIAAETAYINAQTRALGVMGDTPEEETSTRHYRQQNVRLKGTEEQIAKANLIALEAEHSLATLLADPSMEETPPIREQLATSEQSLRAVALQASIWRAESIRERDSVSTLISTVSSSDQDDRKPQFLIWLNRDRLNLAQETLAALNRLGDVIARARLMLELVEREILLRQGWLHRAWVEANKFTTGIWSATIGWASTSLFRIGDTPITSLGIFQTIFIVVVAWLLSKWLRRVLNRIGAHSASVNQHALYTVGRLSHYLIILIGLIVGLSSIGIDFTNFALVAGALSIGIGFGLQSIINNFVSGIIILFDRSLKVGDYVQLGTGVSGEVREINVRSTRINTNENVDVIVPNSEFITSEVVNWTLQENLLRFHVPFEVAYGIDKDLVKEVVLKAARSLPFGLVGVSGKDPDVWLVKFGEYRLEMELVIWVSASAVKRPATVKAKYLWAIETALRENGIPIPVPQRDLHLVSGMKELAEAIRGELKNETKDATLPQGPQALEGTGKRAR
jgi:small-conductance mechanosensitive channel